MTDRDNPPISTRRSDDGAITLPAASRPTTVLDEARSSGADEMAAFILGPQRLICL